MNSPDPRVTDPREAAGDLVPRTVQCGPARLSLRAEPHEQAPQVTEALPGEALEVLWEHTEHGGWTRVRTLSDRYLGWARTGGWVAPAQTELKVTALRAHAYAGPKVSTPVLAELCFGSLLERGEGDPVADETRRWQPVVLPGGQAAYVQEVCFQPLAEATPAGFALRFLETPYVWGGRSAWGLDCSGLTQLVYAAFGHSLPRDADQQQAAVPAVTGPQAGDLAFFKGHVGLMLGSRRLIHANATGMRVTIEELGVGDYGQRLEAGLLGFGRVS